LTYQVVVSEFFLGLRGGGLMLSPLDLELVQSWERRGLPVAVVCRGLRRGLEDALEHRSPAAPPPRSLRSYRLAVEDEWSAYRRGRVGDAPPPPDESSVARRRLEAARAAVEEAVARDDLPPGAREGYRAAALLLAPPPAELAIEKIDALVARADGAIVRGWLSGMARAARVAVAHRSVRHAGPRPPWIRRSQYRETLRAALADEARRAGLLCLRGSV
jgi:hypothetical protein